MPDLDTAPRPRVVTPRALKKVREIPEHCSDSLGRRVSLCSSWFVAFAGPYMGRGYLPNLPRVDGRVERAVTRCGERIPDGAAIPVQKLTDDVSRADTAWRSFGRGSMDWELSNHFCWRVGGVLVRGRLLDGMCRAVATRGGDALVMQAGASGKRRRKDCVTVWFKTGAEDFYAFGLLMGVVSSPATRRLIVRRFR